MHKTRDKFENIPVIYKITQDDYQELALYWGYTNNAYRRLESHFVNHTGFRLDSKFHNFCKLNGLDKSNFKVEILNVSSLDKDAALLLEKYFISNYYAYLNSRDIVCTDQENEEAERILKELDDKGIVFRDWEDFKADVLVSHDELKEIA